MSGALALALLLTMSAQDEQRIVCVPDAQGSGWECGRGADAPKSRGVRNHPAARITAPPPYLMDPARVPAVMRDSVYAPTTGTPVADLAPSDAKPVVQEVPIQRPPPAVGPEPVATVASAPAASAAAPREPASAAVDLPATQSDTAAPPESEPPPSPTGSRAEAQPQPVRTFTSVARDAADLLALPSSHYTVQLVASRSFEGYADFRRQLGLAVEDTFVVEVRRDGERWWLLLWRDFPDLSSARAAASRLRGQFWPRRLAPLQAEVAATPH
ncbi:MAG: SPOR domain-containing protein [Xanthomonadales bacterium]|nr:hypothetical protein [Xanthomonadales bacterium]MCC6593421.1 SPOR domain-containing protein [Xanthomonadales bacterium]MCE7930569.1 hypothetical protein [Xanthomonadales bacterium PRO6]